MSKSNADRQAAYRARKREDEGPLLLLVEHLQEEVKWLRAANESLRNEAVTERNERYVSLRNAVQELTSILSGLGGAGGVSSPISSLSLFPEKEAEIREFQDLKGRTGARETLSNGTRVPGTFGDETSVTNGVTETVTKRVTDRNGAAVFDAEKELRRKPLKDAEMVAKARAEAERLQAEFGAAK